MGKYCLIVSTKYAYNPRRLKVTIHKEGLDTAGNRLRWQEEVKQN